MAPGAGYRWFIAAFAGTLALFTAFPGIDLWVSGQFYSPVTGFWLAGNPVLHATRMVLWAASLLILVPTIFGLVVSMGAGRARQIPRRIWVFVLGVYVLGPGLLVNAVLKQHWGRARPSDTQPFGGTAQFTAPLDITDQCAQNCSFVSGEASVGVAAALVIGISFWFRVQEKHRITLIAGLAFPAALMACMRVATGRHFLSDIMIAGFLMATIALILFRIMGVAAARQKFVRAGVWRDLRATLRKHT
ncbi:phosphatase PAP2 family protein [Pseudogemmobacter sp. W21_MBD1_M6]|uniref:phosphatase PAP2 family protein n=1 Tax=Pseudogemmobacter sp. W21_MBD1_M6 TaxID=3240271 RepID=UPI003F9A753F